jgi:hypothetical protein
MQRYNEVHNRVKNTNMANMRHFYVLFNKYNAYKIRI